MSKKSVLIVDDNENFRETMSDVFLESGYQVTNAASGKDALSLLEDDPANLVLVDVIMPDMGGNDVCRRIKNKFGKKVKVIVITGVVDAVDAAKARAAGADDYVVKTEDTSVLLDAVARLLK